jgi:hypothetical protein
VRVVVVVVERGIVEHPGGRGVVEHFNVGIVVLRRFGCPDR